MISKKEAKQHRLKQLKKRWKKIYKKQTLAKLPKDFQLEYKSYSKPEKKAIKNYYIYGETGYGKTVLACFLFLQFVKSLFLEKGYYPHIKAKFINFPEFLIELQRKMGTMEYHTMIADIMESHFLVLDDLDAKKTTDWIGDMVYTIINHRQKNNLLTIITSNNDLNKLSNVFNDDRIIRRIEKSYSIVNKEHFNKSKTKGK